MIVAEHLQKALQQCWQWLVSTKSGPSKNNQWTSDNGRPGLTDACAEQKLACLVQSP